MRRKLRFEAPNLVVPITEIRNKEIKLMDTFSFYIEKTGDISFDMRKAAEEADKNAKKEKADAAVLVHLDDMKDSWEFHFDLIKILKK